MTVFRTNNMSLAAYLTGEGHAHQSVELTEPHSKSVVWKFRTSKDLEALVDKFFSHQAVVRPADFTRDLAIVRNAMYIHLQELGLSSPRAASN